MTECVLNSKHKGVQAVERYIASIAGEKEIAIKDFRVYEDGYLAKFYANAQSMDTKDFYLAFNELEFPGYDIEEVCLMRDEIGACIIPVKEYTKSEFALNYIEEFCSDAPVVQGLFILVRAFEGIANSSSLEQKRAFKEYIKKVIK